MRYECFTHASCLVPHPLLLIAELLIAKDFGEVFLTQFAERGANAL